MRRRMRQLLVKRNSLKQISQLFEPFRGNSYGKRITRDVMPTVSFPLAQSIHAANGRIETFLCCGLITASEKLFAQEGFVKRNDGLVECISCGAMTQVVQDLPWSTGAIRRLHLTGCREKCSEIEHIFRRANFIQTRVPRGHAMPRTCPDAQASLFSSKFGWKNTAILDKSSTRTLNEAYKRYRYAFKRSHTDNITDGICKRGCNAGSKSVLYRLWCFSRDSSFGGIHTSLFLGFITTTYRQLHFKISSVSADLEKAN